MSMGAARQYGALNGQELWNRARLFNYIHNGVTSNGWLVNCAGCEGLEGIIPCVSNEPPTAAGYQLPELDDAPWYDPDVSESKDFAGLWVQDIKVSTPYARSLSQNIGDGGTLGRLRRPGRTITVRGWLIGRTCCGTEYGLHWLAAALGDTCAGGNCGGSTFDFLDCCPNTGGEDGCLYTTDENGNMEVYVRPDELSEYQRGTDFFRRMHGVGVVDGPIVLDCRGTSCGCSGGAWKQVEFTLATENPYFHSLADTIVEDFRLPIECFEPECNIEWSFTDNCDGCITYTPCADDPLCATQKLPPTPGVPEIECGDACIPQTIAPLTVIPVPSIRQWLDSTINVEITAGPNAPLRNVTIWLNQNPQGRPCTEDVFNICDACASLSISYIPPSGVLRFDGETREVTLTCDKVTVPAFDKVSQREGAGFGWLDLGCHDACLTIELDCEYLSNGSTVTVERVDRSL